ncbi:DUF2937 family protein [Ponticoccus alexandrii]|uniref:DUF2937 family protein n=1 Tax=Ponticoccus alexandrii TaxID=1943633 RepID=A0ABX7F7Y8_9RHOB|nr:DUF2937 family protein [Ponticoccus alexandrii]QRF66604.1 DUF2937 family protein [Ponticoccus alexandrii]
MITRALTLAAGLTGAAGLSQFPEFSQQYMQRLGGAVDELSLQVDRYHADADALGLPLATYLQRLAAEGPLARTQATNMAGDIARHEYLSEALMTLQGAGPFMRAKLATHIGDRAVAERAMESFKPALPLTFEGVTFAGAGFFAGWLALGIALWFLKKSWRTASGFLPSGRRRRTMRHG